MRTSQKGIDLIKEFEGFRKTAYLCPGGVWTIGYGHTKGVKVGDEIDERKAEQLLKEDLRETEDSINRMITVEIDQNQFDALVSLIYNIGSGNFYDSTIRRLINEKCLDIKKIEHAWKMWIRAGGRVLKGLIRRRNTEFELYRKDLWYNR